ncbi:hypothetical protein Tco_0002050 [Tanacetum coccineum]
MLVIKRFSERKKEFPTASGGGLGSLREGIEKFGEVDSLFVPYLLVGGKGFFEKFGGGFELDIDEQDEKKKRSGENDEE